MTKEEHVDFYNGLLDFYGQGHLIWPKCEGAFYFGHELTFDEYTDKYKAELIKRGWLNEK